MVNAFSPLRHRLYRRFLIGQTVSRMGDAVFFVALAWQVVLLGGAEAEIGLVLATFTAAQLGLALAGGVIVDRVSRKRVVVASDIGQGVLVAIAAALAFSGALGMPGLFLLALTFGGAEAVAYPALGAFLPETVPDDDLQAANGLFQGASLGASLVGALLAGLLLTTAGVWSAFAFDAATFAVSAALLGTLPSPPASAPDERKGSLLADLREGWAFLVRVPWLWINIAVFAVVNAAEASPRNVVLPVFVGVHLGGGPIGIAIVVAAFRGGWLVGTLVPAVVAPFKRPGVVIYAGTAISGLMVLGVGFAGAVWQIALLFITQGVAFGIIGVLWTTSVGKYVEKGVRGRVISIDALGSIALMPFSSALGGAATGAIGARGLFQVGGLIVLMCAALGLLYRPARDFRAATPQPAKAA